MGAAAPSPQACFKSSCKRTTPSRQRGKKSAWSAPWTQRNYCLSSRCESVGKPQRTATPARMKKNKGSYLKSICVLENKCSSPPITNRNIHSYNSSGVSRKSWCWLLTLNFFWKIFTNKSDLQETIFFFFVFT